MSQIFTKHNRYFAYGRDVSEISQINNQDIIFTIPIYAYVHSGVVVQASFKGNPFNCQFDSGQCGEIIATRNDILQHFGSKRITKRMLREMPQIMIDQVEALNEDEYQGNDAFRSLFG